MIGGPELMSQCRACRQAGADACLPPRRSGQAGG